MTLFIIAIVVLFAAAACCHVPLPPAPGSMFHVEQLEDR